MRATWSVRDGQAMRQAMIDIVGTGTIAAHALFERVRRRVGADLHERRMWRGLRALVAAGELVRNGDGTYSPGRPVYGPCIPPGRRRCGVCNGLGHSHRGDECSPSHRAWALVEQGASYAEAAAQCGITAATVHGYRDKLINHGQRPKR